MSNCDACGTDEVPLGPMLEDDVWHRLADGHERVLCFECMLARARERNVSLSIVCLRPCAFNLFHRPYSWFDLFVSRESGPPTNLAEWQAADNTLGLPGLGEHLFG